MALRTAYTDVPLDPKLECIRLVRVVGVQEANVIRCEFQCFQLASCPPYKALSYTWGSPRDQKRILIRENTLIIRRNLWEFLLQQRAQSDQDLLWIDALCINQTNPGERNHQVNLMKQIYAQVRLLRK